MPSEPNPPILRLIKAAATAEREGRDLHGDDEACEMLHAAVDAASPDQRLTLLTFLEHPKLLDAVDGIVSETSRGLA